MNINVTLFGEMLTFGVLVWVMMKYIWPPLMKAIEERQHKIASGLEAAERGKQELELVRTNISKQLNQTKVKAAQILQHANQQANEIIAKSKVTAEVERDNMLAQAQVDIEQEINGAKQSLQQHTADLVIAATEKVLQQKINEVAQRKLIGDLISSI